VARQLKRADGLYRAGLDHLEAGRDEEARLALARGLDAGPIDPHLYLELGDIYRQRGLHGRAVSWYGRYLAFMNQAQEAVDDRVLADIAAYVDTEGGRLTDIERPSGRTWTMPLVAAGFLSLLVVGAVVLLQRQRRQSLAELVERYPELHPHLSYAIGCLRHELLKHRLGALGEAAQALRRNRSLNESQRAYLRERLYGGEALTSLWQVYVETFDRLTGRQLDLLRADRQFRASFRAVRSLEGLRPRFAQPEENLAEHLEGARRQLVDFDSYLRRIAERACRCRVDGQLLRDALFAVQGETRAAAVHLDEIRFGEPPPDLFVEVLRSDLLLVLRNLVRNAILAMSLDEASRRVLGLDVALRREPTGDESVLIRVRDTSSHHFTTRDIYSRSPDRGLALVVAAVTRYDGSVAVEEGEGEWSKAVVVRLFRALGEGES
jgi:tetratricopeptide (TPR) repeat protein